MAEMKNNALDTLLDVLGTSGADAWEITDTTEKGWEFYFIRHSLDQHRAKDIRSFSVRVYKKFENFLGSAKASVPADASAEEMRRIVAGLCKDASYVRNPAYTLNRPEPQVSASSTEKIDPESISSDFIRTLAAVPETATENLNSYEIFAGSVTRRFLNSEGIDVTEVYPSSMVEAVVNARRDGHEIELYRLFRSGTCSREQLTQDLAETLAYGRDRLVTSPTPALGKADVVFSTDPARELYLYFIDRLSTDMVYRGMSDWKIGDRVAPDNLTVQAVKYLPNSSGNTVWDEEGAPIRDLVLIDRGKAAAYWGGRQFSQYLGLESSFIAHNFTATGGTESAAELRRGDFLEVVEFSDFQADPVTGDFAGEIRLAYLHRNNQTTPVSGGSVSGNIRETADGFRFSKETRQYNDLLIPAVTRLRNVTVTGAGDDE